MPIKASTHRRLYAEGESSSKREERSNKNNDNNDDVGLSFFSFLALPSLFHLPEHVLAHDVCTKGELAQREKNVVAFKNGAEIFVEKKTAREKVNKRNRANIYGGGEGMEERQ